MSNDQLVYAMAFRLLLVWYVIWLLLLVFTYTICTTHFTATTTCRKSWLKNLIHHFKLDFTGKTSSYKTYITMTYNLLLQHHICLQWVFIRPVYYYHSNCSFITFIREVTMLPKIDLNIQDAEVSMSSNQSVLVSKK